MKLMREAGHSIIIITTEASLTEMMVGKKVALNIVRPEPVNPQKRLVMEHVTCVD